MPSSPVGRTGSCIAAYATGLLDRTIASRRAADQPQRHLHGTHGRRPRLGPDCQPPRRACPRAGGPARDERGCGVQQQPFRRRRIRRAGRGGMIGIAVSNSAPAIAPHPCHRALGTNPIGVGVPLAAGAPWCSTWRPPPWRSASARCWRRNEIPAGWALDADGNPRPTRPPSRARCCRSAAQGLGLALLVELLERAGRRTTRLRHHLRERGEASERHRSLLPGHQSRRLRRHGALRAARRARRRRDRDQRRSRRRPRAALARPAQHCLAQRGRGPRHRTRPQSAGGAAPDGRACGTTTG